MIEEILISFKAAINITLLLSRILPLFVDGSSIDVNLEEKHQAKSFS